jgi:hypothetical protein
MFHQQSVWAGHFRHPGEEEGTRIFMMDLEVGKVRRGLPKWEGTVGSQVEKRQEP